MTVLLPALTVLVFVLVVMLVALLLRPHGLPFGHGQLSWRQRRAIARKEATGPEKLAQVSSLDAAQSWTPIERLPMSPMATPTTRRIALGHPTDRNAHPIPGRMVCSPGDTPVGIVSGATGSWKTSTILAEAVLMHGRDDSGALIGRTDGTYGSPMLLAAPKTELFELSLESRKLQGPVVIFDVGGGENLPPAGLLDENGVPHPDLRPFLGTWSPISECATWKDAQATARSMCEGAMGGKGDGKFWEASASRLVAAALWLARLRGLDNAGRGACLLDVYKMLNRDVVEEDGSVTPPTTTLINELEVHLTVAQALPQPDEARTEDIELAIEAIADLVNGAETAIGSIRTTATTALSAALHRGVAFTPWNDPKAIDIEHYLVDTSGTIGILGTFSELRAFRPITAAFMDAVRRRLEARTLSLDGGRLERQVLVVIDELATIVSSGELFSEWMASSRSQHVQHLWAAQDVAGLNSNFGEELAQRVISNTITKMWLPFSSDIGSLELAEKLAGDHLTWTETRTTGDSKSRNREANGKGAGKSTATNSSKAIAQAWRPIAPVGRLAAMQAGEALMISAGDRAQLGLRQWFTDPTLKGIAAHGMPPGLTPPQPRPQRPALTPGGGGH